jgi:hypothetical protein
MSRNLFASPFAASVLFCCTGLAAAQQSGTAEEAKAMLDRAVAAVKADKATALGEFNDKNNKQFHDRPFAAVMRNGHVVAAIKQFLGGGGPL